MADTVRNRADLLALFGDNTTGDCTPQRLRDGIVSILGVAAQLYATGASTGQTMGTSPTTLDWGMTGGADGLEDNANADKANDKIAIGTYGAGWYLALLTLSFSGTASTTFTIKLAVGGTPAGAVTCKAKLDAAGSVLNVAASGIVNLADGDNVTVQVTADGATKTFTLEEGGLTLRRIR